jgi:hypothetical protein
MVGVAELPWRTRSFSPAVGGSSASRPAVLLSWRRALLQALVLRCTTGFFWTSSAGTRIASGRGITGSVNFGIGTGKCLTGAGACGIGGGVLDQANEVVVVLPGLKNIRVQDGHNHEESNHHRLHAIAENEPPQRVRVREEGLRSIVQPGNPCPVPHVVYLFSAGERSGQSHELEAQRPRETGRRTHFAPVRCTPKAIFDVGSPHIRCC